MTHENHDAAAQAGAGDLRPDHAGHGGSNVDHLVDFRRAARINAVLHAQLGPQHALRVFTAQVAEQPLQIFVAAVIVDTLIAAVGTRPADAISVVADLHQRAELFHPSARQQVDAHAAADDLRDAVQQHPAGMIGRRLGMGGKTAVQQPLMLGGKHGAEIVPRHAFRDSEQPAVNITGRTTQFFRINIAQVLHGAGDFRAALFQQGQPQVVAGDARIELVAGRSALAALTWLLAITTV